MIDQQTQDRLRQVLQDTRHSERELDELVQKCWFPDGVVLNFSTSMACAWVLRERMQRWGFDSRDSMKWSPTGIQFEIVFGVHYEGSQCLGGVDKREWGFIGTLQQAPSIVALGALKVYLVKILTREKHVEETL